MFRKLFNIFTLSSIRSYFITGIVIIGPFFLTFYLIYFLVSSFASFSRMFIGFFANKDSLVVHIPGLSMILTLVIIILVGATTRNFLGQVIVRWSEAILAKTPLVRAIYSTTKQIFSLVSSDKKGSTFGKPVLVEYPKDGLWVVGFITNSNKHPKINEHLEDRDLRSVFVPTTPNPTSGFVLFVEKKDIVLLDASVEDAMKLIISAGSVGLEDIKLEKIAKNKGKEEPRDD